MHDTDKVLQKLEELSGNLKSLQGNVSQLQETSKACRMGRPHYKQMSKD